MKARVLLVLAGTALLTFASAQQQPGSKDEKWGYRAMDEVPAKARARHNPLEGNMGAMGAGKKLFADHCAECHGKDANGTRRAPNLRVKQVQQASPGALFWVISNGVVRRGMPVWSKLPEPERWQIVTFLMSLGTGSGVSQK